MPISVKQLLKALRSDIKAHNSSYKEQQRGMQELGITKLKEGRIDPIRMIRQNQIEFDDVPDLENLVAKRQFVVPTGLTSDLGATHLDVTFDPAVGYVVSPRGEAYNMDSWLVRDQAENLDPRAILYDYLRSMASELD